MKSILAQTLTLVGLGITVLVAGAQSPAGRTNQTQSKRDDSQPTAGTNPTNRVEVNQAALIQRLLERVEQLEKASTEKTESARAEEEARIEQLLRRINELEGKLQSLEAGRVLPEIVITPEDGPTAAELDQKIRVLERNQELATEAAELAAELRAKESPRISIGENGFSLSSADTNYVLKLRGLLQLDSRTFFGDNSLSEGNDSFSLRRARPILEGTLFRDVDFLFAPDFGGSSVRIFDAYLNYRLRPELQFRAGKFKGPVGFEMLQSDATLPFNERSLVSSLVPVRSIGFQVGGDVADGAFSYAVGAFNIAGDSRNPDNTTLDDDKEFAAGLRLQPFKQSGLPALRGLGFGLGGSYSQSSSNALALPGTTGGQLPGYTTSALQQFFAYNPVVGPVVADGAHWRISPHVSYLYGPFGVLGEYAISHQGVYNSTTLRAAELEHSAWQVTAQWVLTGEPASFTGITPRRPFDLRSGGWGAWQLVARYSQLSIDDEAFNGFSNPATSASVATSWSVGINWWLNKNLRVLTGFSHTTFDGGGGINLIDSTTLVPPATVTHQDEKAFLTRLQLSF